MFKRLFAIGAIIMAFATMSYCFVVSSVSLGLILNKPQVSTGVDLSYLYQATAAGWYFAAYSGTFSPHSDLSVKVYYGPNGASLGYTSPILGASQTSLQFKVPVNCLVGDIVKIVLYSNNASDAAPNAVKSTAAIQQGQ